MTRLTSEEQRAVSAIVEAVTAYQEGSGKPKLSHGWSIADDATADQAFRGGNAAGRSMIILLHANPSVVQEANERLGGEFIPGTDPSRFLYVRRVDS